MKITVFNGSPKGEAGNTNLMVTAFLAGAKEAGAETENIFLAGREINHCRACFVCIMSGVGRCAIPDDMAELITRFLDSDIVVLATPVYIENISGMLKVFMDRLFSIGNPRYEEEPDEQGEYIYGKSRLYKNGTPPKIVVISNGGYPQKSAFQVISLLMKNFTRHFGMDLLAEIYKPQAGVFAMLQFGAKQYEPLVNDYKNLLHKAGREIVTDMKLSAETQSLLEKDFMPAESCVQLVNAMADMIPAYARASKQS